jgi:hypothetical protein
MSSPNPTANRQFTSIVQVLLITTLRRTPINLTSSADTQLQQFVMSDAAMHDEVPLQPVQREQDDTNFKGQNPKTCTHSLDYHFSVICLCCYFERRIYSAKSNDNGSLSQSKKIRHRSNRTRLHKPLTNLTGKRTVS